VAEELISEGQYVKAAGTLKQDLEVLARIGETIQGVERVGRTPNVRYAPAGAGPLYGQLNKVAHPSDPTLIATLLGTTSTERLTESPMYPPLRRRQPSPCMRSMYGCFSKGAGK
jgi:hypothetical protein